MARQIGVSPVTRISTRGIEVQNGWSAFLVGAYLLWPADTFSTASGYRLFAATAPEWVWGAVFLVLGLTQLAAALTDHLIGRRIAASLLAILFGIYVLGIAYGNPVSAAIPFVLPMVIGQAVAFFQARRVV